LYVASAKTDEGIVPNIEEVRILLLIISGVEKIQPWRGKILIEMHCKALLAFW
jgi:hypothetical protein